MRPAPSPELLCLLSWASLGSSPLSVLAVDGASEPAIPRRFGCQDMPRKALFTVPYKLGVRLARFTGPSGRHIFTSPVSEAASWRHRV